MKVQAVVAVGAGLRAGVIRAFGHATQVVLVEEFAGISFLTQAAEPVLADEIVI